MFQRLDANFPVRYTFMGLCALGVLLALFSIVAFGVGWLSHGQVNGSGGSGGLQLAGGPGRTAQAFVHQASLAHAVFSPEVGHPVGVTERQPDHLVHALPHGLGRPRRCAGPDS